MPALTTIAGVFVGVLALTMLVMALLFRRRSSNETEVDADPDGVDDPMANPDNR